MNRLLIFRIVWTVIGSIFFIFGVIKYNQPAEVTEPKNNFEVVDNYRGCDLVRWTSSQLAEYKYVLYCPK